MRRIAAPVLLVWGVLSSGCGPVEEASEPIPLAHQAQDLKSLNGLSANGLSANGLSANGLSANGLSANGLATLEFKTWFQTQAMAETVMRYLVHCALPEDRSLSYTDDITGQTYTWSGGLGVAPNWGNGQPATVAEQQVVSACMAAHVNKYGMNIPISVLGKTADGTLISFTSAELNRFLKREACFFGNLFTGEGIYVGNDRGQLNARQSTARACTLSSNATNTRTTDCMPLEYVGSCTTYCTLDPTSTYYTSCLFNGVTYKPITTRLRKEDIYYCGDGVCQFTESCGTDNQYYNCGLDCGPCQ